MITDYFMITEKSNRLQVIMITDYDYPNSEALYIQALFKKALYIQGLFKRVLYIQVLLKPM